MYLQCDFHLLKIMYRTIYQLRDDEIKGVQIEHVELAAEIIDRILFYRKCENVLTMYVVLDSTFAHFFDEKGQEWRHGKKTYYWETRNAWESSRHQEEGKTAR